MGIERLHSLTADMLPEARGKVQADLGLDIATNYTSLNRPAEVEMAGSLSIGAIVHKDSVEVAESQGNFTDGTRYGLSSEELELFADDSLVLQALALTHEDLYDEQGDPTKFKDWKEMIKTIVKIRGEKEAVVYAANRQLTERGFTDFIKEDGFSFTPNVAGIAYIDRVVQEKLPHKKPKAAAGTDINLAT